MAVVQLDATHSANEVLLGTQVVLPLGADVVPVGPSYSTAQIDATHWVADGTYESLGLFFPRMAAPSPVVPRVTATICGG